MYVAVKGGEKAIENAHRWLSEKRRGNTDLKSIELKQISEQLFLSVSRVMAEGSLYDKELASLAIKQSSGDLIEAIFLLRAYRTTLPRFGYSKGIETDNMICSRRISATYKDLPGGQILGPTYDYTHRLLDFKLIAEEEVHNSKEVEIDNIEKLSRVSKYLNKDDLIKRENNTSKQPKDLTREPLELPADRSLRLQSLTRSDEGFLLGMAYSTQRGYGRNHPFVGELRIGIVDVFFEISELGIEIEIGEIEITECETVNQFMGSKKEPPQFTRGYGLVFGQSERKAISMALVDRALQWKELGEENQNAPAQDEEFVLYHGDNIQATGFVEHIKLPHYVDFQSELELIRKIRKDAQKSEK
jgi:alpha-D-ribose 1-methylphosphonate 5-triphosphate synthase subunit PhnI